MSFINWESTRCKSKFTVNQFIQSGTEVQTFSTKKRSEHMFSGMFCLRMSSLQRQNAFDTHAISIATALQRENKPGDYWKCYLL